MALNGTVYGSFSGTDTSNVRPAIKWSASQSVSGNYSDITAKFVIYRYNTSWQSYNKNGAAVTISIDGNSSSSTQEFDIRSLPSGGYDQVWSRTVRVYHNESGYAMVDLRGSINTNISLGTGSVAGTIYPSAIPRSSTISSNGAVEFGHSIQINIKRKHKSYADDIFIVRPSGSEVKIASKTTAKSVRYTIPNDWASDVPNNTSINYKIKAKTYQGSNLIGTSYTYQTVDVPELMAPSISNISITDTDLGIDSRFGYFIQDISKFRVSFTVSNRGGATTKENKVIYTDKSKRDTSGSSSFNEVISTLGFSSNLIQMYSTDSRGRTSRVTRTVEALPYQKPEISTFKVERCDSDGSLNDTGTYAKVTYRVKAMYLNKYNYPKSQLSGTQPDLYIEYKSGPYSSPIKLEQRFSEPLSYDNSTVLDTGVQSTLVSNIDSNKSYEFSIHCHDYFNDISLTKTLGTGFVTRSFLHGGKGVTWGRNATQEGFNVFLEPFRYKGQDVVTSQVKLGDPANGWVVFSNGLQITWSQHHVNKGANNWISLPKNFKTEPVLILTPRRNAVVWQTNLDPKNANVQTSQDTDITLIAIGEAEE